MTEPLVFLPEMMCDARFFMPQITAFSSQRAVLVAPLTVGHRIEDIASGILDQLPLRFALVGHGMGGIVAMELLRRAPDRVSRVCLMDTNPLAETPAEAATRDLMIARAQAGRLTEAMREVMPSDHLAPGPGRAAVLAQLDEMSQDLGVEVFVRQSRALQRRRDQQSTLRKCKASALIVCGEHDTLTPVKRHSFMAELMPNAELKVIPDAGHIPSLETPDAVIDILQGWLGQPLILR